MMTLKQLILLGIWGVFSLGLLAEILYFIGAARGCILRYKKLDIEQEEERREEKACAIVSIIISLVCAILELAIIIVPWRVFF